MPAPFLNNAPPPKCLPIAALIDHIPIIRDHPFAFGLLALFASLASLYLLYRWWMHCVLANIPQPPPLRQATPEEIQALETSLGGPLPAALRTAYLTGTLLHLQLPLTASTPTGEELTLTEFLPADAPTNTQLVQYDALPQNAFLFATDDFGNYYFVQPNTPEVSHWDHEGSSITPVANTFEAFWQMFTPKSS